MNNKRLKQSRSTNKTNTRHTQRTDCDSRYSNDKVQCGWPHDRHRHWCHGDDHREGSRSLRRPPCREHKQGTQQQRREMRPHARAWHFGTKRQRAELLAKRLRFAKLQPSKFTFVRLVRCFAMYFRLPSERASCVNVQSDATGDHNVDCAVCPHTFACELALLILSFVLYYCTTSFTEVQQSTGISCNTPWIKDVA